MTCAPGERRRRRAGGALVSGRGSRRIAPLLAALALLLTASAASAADPGRWTLTGRSTLPPEYVQGLASDASGVMFAGPQIGLHRTDLALGQTTSVARAIHPEVMAGEGFNHIGDLAYDARAGGRLLLALECYSPFQGSDPSDPDNPCLRGAIGIADPATLAWRWHVPLDPAEIAKVMWVAIDDAGLVWTQSGLDLLAYDVDGTGRPLKATRRVPGAAPGKCTGAVFFRARLFCATYGEGAFRIWSVDVNAAGAAPQLEIERPFAGEAEGLDVFPGHGGRLHWIVVPDLRTGAPSFGRQFPTLLHFSPAGEPVAGAPARAASIRVTAKRRAKKLSVRATTVVSGRTFAVRFATARVGRRKLELDDDGRGTLRLGKARRGSVKVTSKGLRAGSRKFR
jgi:hypothetical protein